MNDIKVSIIVAVYNTERYLDRCLSSLVNQTLKEIEIICVNDASTDGSLKKLKEWEQKDSRIRVFSYENNMRQGHARNLAIKEARGQYIGIVDSDDFIDERMYQSLIENSDNMTSDLVVSNAYFIYDNGKTEEKHIFLPPLRDLIEIKKYVASHDATMCTNIIRRDYFLNNNLFYPEKLLYEDNANGHIIYLKANSINVVEQGFYYYCVNPQSSVRKKNSYSLFNRTITAKMFYERARNEDFYETLKEEIDFCFFILFLYNTVLAALKSFNILPYKETKAVLEEYRDISGLSIKDNHLFRDFTQNKMHKLIAYSSIYGRMSILMMLSLVLWLKGK